MRSNNPSILIVEDNKINAFIVKRFMEKKYLIHIAENGHKALEEAKTHEFDLVLMDINLGDEQLDGIEVLKHMRTLDQYQSTPIIATTAYALDGDRERFLNEGFNAYIAKPLRKADLLQKVEELLKS